MTWSIVLLSVAQQEFDAGADWYEVRQSGLGTEFIAEVRATILRITAHPHSFPIARGKVRRARVNRFPYSIYYRLETHTVVVVAVYHHARRPGAWWRRH